MTGTGAGAGAGVGVEDASAEGQVGEQQYGLQPAVQHVGAESGAGPGAGAIAGAIDGAAALHTTHSPVEKSTGRISVLNPEFACQRVQLAGVPVGGATFPSVHPTVWTSSPL